MPKRVVVGVMAGGALVLLLSGSPVNAAGPFRAPNSTGAYRDSYQLLLHQRNAARLAAAPAAVSYDAGDVAVIVDNGAIIVPAQPEKRHDLALPSALAFTPEGAGLTVAPSSTALDAVFGTDLGLLFDSTVEVPFPAGFPFLGITYTSVWVNSDGNLTFGEGDDYQGFRNAGFLIGGPPRIAPFLADLVPGLGGSVYADVRTDRLVVTWAGLPAFGTTDANTFQAVLHQDGAIDFVYHQLETPFGVVGIAEGGNERPFRELDLSAELPATFTGGALFEEFNPEVPFQQLDIWALAREFYRTHEDKYDFLAMFTDFPVHELGGAGFVGYHAAVSNHTLGLGFRGIFDWTTLAGSAGELESMLVMNNIRNYWPDAGKMVDPPIIRRHADCDELDTLVLPGCSEPGPGPVFRARRFGTLDGDDLGGERREQGVGDRGSFSLGLESAMSALAEEVGHRWLITVAFLHPTKGWNGVDNWDLIGRADVHWSLFFNTRVPASQFGGVPRLSTMLGSALAHLGPDACLHLPFPCTRPGESTFSTEPDQLTDGFSELDQYFMGLRRADEVGPFWYVDEPRSPVSDIPLDAFSTITPIGGAVPFCGKRVDLTVADITILGTIFGFPPHGPRIPELGDEVDAVIDGQPIDVKTMAFILLVEPGPEAHAAMIHRVDTVRSTWQDYGNGPATGGRGRFDTSLSPAVH